MATAPDAATRRAFIVWALANFIQAEDFPNEFSKQFPGVARTDFPTVGEINACDPRRLTGEWRDYFDQERAAFYETPNDKKFRMAMLSRLAAKNISRGGDAPAGIALKALELLAKEDAGFYAPKGPTKGDDAKDGPSTFTFGLDRVQQD